MLYREFQHEYKEGDDYARKPVEHRTPGHRRAEWRRGTRPPPTRLSRTRGSLVEKARQQRVALCGSSTPTSSSRREVTRGGSSPSSLRPTIATLPDVSGRLR